MAHTEITVNNTDKDSLEYYGLFVSFVILENFGNGDSHGFDVRAPTGLCTPCHRLVFGLAVLGHPHTGLMDGSSARDPSRWSLLPGAFLSPKSSHGAVSVAWCCMAILQKARGGSFRARSAAWCRHGVGKSFSSSCEVLVAATGVLCDPTISVKS